MAGKISSEDKCPICGASFDVDNGKNLSCQKHKSQHPTNYRVRLKHKGDPVQRRFGTYEEASRFLNGVRFKIDEGSFDSRDYKADIPLGFANLARKWLELRKTHVEQGTLAQKSWNNLNSYMQRAIKSWGNRSVKEISYADFEDFLFIQKGELGFGDVSGKTRSNGKSCLSDFWQWLLKRREITLAEMPHFPETPFTLATRKTVGHETQDAIIDEVKRISYQTNPRIWIGIKWLSTYFSIRPGELISIKEGQIDLENGLLLLEPNDTKERKLKPVPIEPEDVELIRSFPRSFPEMPFFRHTKGIGGAKAGTQFGDRYLYKWWIKACENLGIKGVDLYGGTRHSTVIALGEFFTPEQLKAASMHSTNKAFERYYRVQTEQVREVHQKRLDMRRGSHETTRHSSVKPMKPIGGIT